MPNPLGFLLLGNVGAVSVGALFVRECRSTPLPTGCVVLKYRLHFVFVLLFLLVQVNRGFVSQ